MASGSPPWPSGACSAVLISASIGASLGKSLPRLDATLSEDTVGFVTAAGNLYLLLGSIGRGGDRHLGVPLQPVVSISRATIEKIAPDVFLFVAASFAADRLVLFTSAVLSGLRRFGTMNAIAAGAALVRLIGSLTLLWMGRTILAIAVWNCRSLCAVGLGSASVREFD